MRATTIIMLAIAICSCKEKQVVYEELPDNLFDMVKVIEPVFEKELDKKQDVAVYDDSLVVMVNTPMGALNSGYFVEMYNMAVDTVIAHCLHYGKDKEDLLGAVSYRHENTILVYDYVKSCIYKVDLPALMQDTDLSFSGKKTNICTQYMIPYGDVLLLQNPNCFDVGVAEYTNNGKRFVVSDKNFNYTERKKYKYDTFNVVRGFFLMNAAKNRIFYVDAYRNGIEIYDKGLALLAVVTGPEQILPSYSEYEEVPEFKSLLFYGDIPETYTALAASEDYVYAAYSGGRVCSDDKRDRFESYILKFDWNGCLEEVSKVNVHIKSLSCSGNGKVLYVYGQSSTSEYKLQKYVMEL